MECQRPSFVAPDAYPKKYCLLNSSAMPAVAESRSRAERMISVRPPLSSVMLRSASSSTLSLPELDVRVGRGCGLITGGRLPGKGLGIGIRMGGSHVGWPRCWDDELPP